MFRKILDLKGPWLDSVFVMPFLPSIDDTWNGHRIAEWLIFHKIVEPSRRAFIAKNLNGKLLFEGRVHEVLNEPEIERINILLKDKLTNITDMVWSVLRSSDAMELGKVIGKFFNILLIRRPEPCTRYIIASDINFDLSYEGVKNEFKKVISPKTLEICPIKPCKYSKSDGLNVMQLALEKKYRRAGEVTQPFFKHIVDLSKTNPDEYYACYALLLQGRGMGKTRLISETLEDDKNALFIININCDRCKECNKLYLETSKFVNFMLRLKSLSQMSRLLLSMLYVVFDKTVGNENYLVDNIKLSHTLEEIGVTFKEIFQLYMSPDYKAIVTEGYKAVKNTAASIKLECRDLETEKKIIPVVVFDEATCLLDNRFQLETMKNSSLHLGELTSTFQLIGQVLNAEKECFWKCPFAFSSSSIRFLNAHDGGNPQTAEKIFDPFILPELLNVFADEKKPDWEYYGGLIPYITTRKYSRRLSRIGRPLWGAMLRAEDASKQCRSLLFHSTMWLARREILYNPKFEQKDRLLSAMAMFGIFGLADWSETEYVGDLVERKMAILRKSEKNPAKYTAFYPREPILAIATYGEFCTYMAEIMEDLLILQRSSFLQAVGPIEGFLLKIILLYSQLFKSIELPYMDASSLFVFLIGKQYLNELKKIEGEFLSGFVNFSHLTSVEYPGNDLERYFFDLFARNTAASILGNKIIIPVASLNRPLECICFQSVVSAQSLVDSSILDRMMQSNLQFFPRIIVIMNLSPSVPERFTMVEGYKCTAVLVEGFKNCFSSSVERSPSLEKQFQTLLSTTSKSVGSEQSPSIECVVVNGKENTYDVNFKQLLLL